MWLSRVRRFASKGQKSPLYVEPSYRLMTRNTLHAAGKLSQLPASFLDSLEQCDFTLKVQIPIKRDDGTLARFNAYRAHHNTYTLPLKGGVRFSPTTTMEVAESMATQNTLKLAVVDLPLGGSGGGIEVDPSDLSLREFEQLIRKYSEALFTRDMMSPAIDVLGPEIGANEWSMAIMMDTYRSHQVDDVNSLASMTGKPVTIGGVRGRNEAGGMGAYLALREFCSDAKMMGKVGLTPGLSNKSYILAGFGNMGSTIAKVLSEKEKNARIIAVIEKDGCTYNPDGLNIPELTEHFQRHKTVKGFDGGQTFSKARHILSKPCDILIPATIEQYINSSNVESLQCKILAECTNSGVTEYADNVLKGKNILVLPDMILMSGSLTVSFLEYVKDLGHIALGKMTKRWQERGMSRIYNLLEKVGGKKVTLQDIKGAGELDLVNNCLEDVMSECVKKTKETSEKLNVDYRMASWVNALNRIYEKKKFLL